VRAVVTRVSDARVSVDGTIVGAIERGLLSLVGVAQDDTADDAAYLARKTAGLRIFRDDAGAMNRSLEEAGGSVLAVSQFTLLGDVRKGRRPSFASAAGGEHGLAVFDRYVAELRGLGVAVQTGRFGATMEVISTNDGPVTILLDSKRLF
jgi:D-tyrosyl-tRNA(Tyr) deacylase